MQNNNEVLVDKSDKERLVELLTEANRILEHYPYFTGDDIYYVTTMSRAKSSVKDSLKWCRNLSLRPSVHKRTVTFWEDVFSCVDRVEIEFIDEDDFMKKVNAHAKMLMDKGIELAGSRW